MHQFNKESIHLEKNGFIFLCSKGVYAKHVKNSFRKLVLALITWSGVKM